MGIAALPFGWWKGAERRGSGAPSPGDGLWSASSAAVRDGDQRQAVIEAFIRSDADHACDRLPFVRERPIFDAPTAKL